MTAALPQPPAPASLPIRTSAFSLEFEFLLACCAESADAHSYPNPPHNLDWSRFIQVAQRHGVVPLVYSRLAAVDSPVHNSLPTLRSLYQANTQQALWLTGELLRILKHLNRSGVEVLPYKGPVLAELLYGNIAMREFIDIDLLIRVTDLPRVKASLADLGYESSFRLTPRQEHEYLRSGYEYAFDSQRGANLIEVKWQILPRFYCVDFDIKALFDRTITVELSGSTVHTLSNEDLLLVLCVHAAKHAWVQLSWLCDIAKLASIRSLNWDSICNQAEQLRVGRIVAVTFLLAYKLFATPLPPLVLQLVEKDPAAEAVVERAVSIIASANEYPTESMPYFRLMMDSRERWQDRLRFLWRLASTPSVHEWSAIRLPGPLFPLYRAVRIYRLTKRFLQTSSPV